MTINVGETVGDTVGGEGTLFCFWAEEGATYQVEASAADQRDANQTILHLPAVGQAGNRRRGRLPDPREHPRVDGARCGHVLHPT